MVKNLLKVTLLVKERNQDSKSDYFVAKPLLLMLHYLSMAQNCLFNQNQKAERSEYLLFPEAPIGGLTQLVLPSR